VEARDLRTRTYAEYVAFERSAERKHEYVNGRVYAMAGGTPEHARLAGAVIGALSVALRGKACVPFSSDLRVRIAATGRATYPDVTVVCGALVRDAEDPDAVQNPTVLVEVLSDTTESDDRGEKWAHYQRIPSLREYVLVSQRAPRVEVFTRDEADPAVWHYRDHGPGAQARLASIDAHLDVDALYAGALA
jgi:Uma2 family endonuclease